MRISDETLEKIVAVNSGGWRLERSPTLAWVVGEVAKELQERREEEKRGLAQSA